LWGLHGGRYNNVARMKPLTHTNTQKQAGDREVADSGDLSARRALC
jgi:hypothetical protein